MPLPDPQLARIRRHKPQVEAALDDLGLSVYLPTQLRAFISSRAAIWRLRNVPAAAITEFLLQESALSELTLKSEAYKDEVRFAWRTPSPFELALSLRANAYLCHATAAYLHGLTQDIPTTFFVNKEQSPKPAPTLGLTQAGIDRAFAAQQRRSAYTLTDPEDRRYVLIAGKSTGRLEVGEITGPSGERLDATKPERTLIDLTVRPGYAGGVQKVLDAFTGARGRISVNVLMATLKKLDYVYPYHQAVGFYLERAGFDGAALDLARRPGITFDFYLAHGLKEREYSEEWRVFYPRGL